MAKVTYWTTACLEPDIEAVSKEVVDLADHFPASRIFSVNRHLRFTVRQRGRLLGFSPKFDPLLRLCIPLFERATAINHVYSDVSPWTFLRTLRRRPIVLTIASEQGTLHADFLRRCAAVTVQTEGMRRRLAEVDLDPRKVRLIYPGVDLTRFQHIAGRKPGKRVSVLLATFPRTEGELESRGILFLMDMAQEHRDIDFTFVSRPWNVGSTALAAVKGMIQARGLNNVAVLEGVQQDMSELYRRADFTVLPFTTANGGKECPRSLVESLACGVPVLISNEAPFASFVRSHECGVSFKLQSGGFRDAVSTGVAAYATLSSSAARCAQANFDKRAMLSSFSRIYRELGHETPVH